MATDTIPEVRPYRLGVVDDLPTLRATFGELWQHGLELAVAEAQRAGHVDRPIELVRREAVAQPWDDARPVVDAFRELADDERVLGIAGPMTTDNCLAVLPEIERSGVPTVAICGTQRFVGHAAFNLSNGGMGDEPALMAAWLRQEGHRRVAVLVDSPSQIGEEYERYFRWAAADQGITIVATEPVAPAAEVAVVTTALGRLRGADAEALVYLGLGQVTRKAGPGLEELGWDPPRIMTTAFVGADNNSDKARRLRGWVGVDQFHEGNPVFQRMADRWDAFHGYRPRGAAATVGYDVGTVLARGLGRMRIATPAGLRDALETIRRLPACTGGPGTVITFGPQDHRGFKGADFLVLRRSDGERTSLVGTVPVV